MRTLLFELAALLDAEAMLLVDDHEREPLERHAFLEQRVRADDDGRAPAGDRRERRCANARGLSADQCRDLDTERREPAIEAREMLFGEQLRRRHDGRLATRRGSNDGRHRRDHGLAAADVALQQAIHRRAGFEVGHDLGERARLGRRQAKRQRRTKSLEHRARLRQRLRLLRSRRDGGAA